MKILEVQQGTDQWRKLRESHYCASDAPAMKGASTYKSRDQLLQEKATGVVPEVDARKQALFDEGHAAEANARPIIEKLIGEDLYPAVIEEGDLLASLDGLNLGGDIVYEHKLWNAKLADQVRRKELEKTHYWQLEHQLLVSQAKKVIFVVSDGTEEKMVWMEYFPVNDRSVQLIAGWGQFAVDLKAFEPVVVEEKPRPEAVQALPALSVQLVGEVTSSNLIAYEQTAWAMVEAISTDLQTDQDFANAKNMVKVLKQAEVDLKSAKTQALEQATSIAEVYRTIDRLVEAFSGKRLDLYKLVKSREGEVKSEIVGAAKAALMRHVDSVSVQYNRQVMESLTPDFAGAIKGKRTVLSLQSAANDELARCKIEANQLGERIDKNDELIQCLIPQEKFLFPDAVALILKDPEDFAILVASRIDEHDKVRKEKLQERITQIQMAVVNVATASLDDVNSILMKLQRTDPDTFEERSEEVAKLLVSSITALQTIAEHKQKEADEAARQKEIAERVVLTDWSALIEVPPTDDEEEQEVGEEPLKFGSTLDHSPTPNADIIIDMVTATEYRGAIQTVLEAFPPSIESIEGQRAFRECLEALSSAAESLDYFVNREESA